ncbi:MAG: DNA polymerase subunit beta [Desulfurococcales archaeon ex4484_217_2]|nr:MAG: DNA polymerase subunit beta [Desulfurococcales archaeon ex4484_217_2]
MENKGIDPLVKKIVFDFKNRIEKELGIRVSYILFFGSRARGDYRRDSDIDLIIISDEWHGSLTDRMSRLYRLWNYDIDATLIPLTPAELEERINNSITIRDASKYWKVIDFE